MSTTITYKGSTLTTAENQTRILKTAGKYMEGDVIVVDTTPPDGDLLGYGDNTVAMVGTGQVGYLVVGPDTLIGTAKIGDRLA